MSAPIGQVFELTATDKLPGVYLKTIFGVGGNVANQIRYLLIVGSKALTGGTLTADTEIADIIADGDEITLSGDEGSELARMVRSAKRIDGVQIKVATVSQTSTAAAIAIITITGTWSVASSGPIRFRIGGQAVDVFALADDTATTFGDAIVAAITADAKLPVTAVNVAGVVTLTQKSYGTRGNDHILWCDDTYAPSGMTIALGGSVGGTVASSVGPWDLDHGDTLVVAFNAGGNQTFTISATRAARESTNAETFALSDGMILTVKIDAQAVAQSITFLTAEFVAIGAATAEEVAAVINAKIVGATATVTSGGTKVTITSDTYGTNSHVEVTGGTANTPLNFATAEVDGTGNVADVSAVTAAEWVTIMAAITNGTAEDDGGALRLTSTTVGASGTAQIVASSTADDEMVFDNAVHSGSAGGATVASGGVRFTGGAATENMTTLLETLEAEQYFTVACSIIDATNLARLETATDDKAGPLVRLFEQVVVGSTKAFASSTSLAQTTLDNVRFEMLDCEEGETPGEEQAAWFAAVRHQRESSHPNQKYDGMATPFVPQEASSKRMNRARQVAALDVGLTCVPTKNGVAYIPRAITTRSLTSTGAADDGTIDVGQSRTPDSVNEIIGSQWNAYTNSEDPSAHHYLRNDPAAGEEADIPAGITYPQDWQREVTLTMKRLENLNWVVEVDEHPTVVNMNPTSSTPRFVQYTPVVVTPLTHQLEGTIAQTKFVAK